MFRSAWVLFVGLLATGWHAGAVVLRALTGRLNECRCEEAAREWSRKILRAAGARVRFEGLENLPRDRAQILVSNHESWFDVFALAAELPVSARFVAKKELEAIPLFGRAWVSCGHISVDRSDRSAAIDALEDAGTKIRKEGHTVIFFPEGTRSSDGRLLPFKKGAFVLAIQAGVPVVPAAIRGTREIMPKGSFRIRPGEIVVRIGEPIQTRPLEHPDRDALRDRARTAVSALRAG